MLDAYIFPRLLEEFAKSLKGTGATAEASRLMAVGYGPNITERKELHFTSHYRPCDKTSVTCATSNDNEKERQVKNSDSRRRAYCLIVEDVFRSSTSQMIPSIS
jgi:hypothetical protein